MSEHFEIKSEVRDRLILIVGIDEQLTENEIKELLKTIRRLKGVTDAEKFDSEETGKDLAVQNKLKFQIQEALREYVRQRSMDIVSVEEFIGQHLLLSDS